MNEKILGAGTFSCPMTKEESDWAKTLFRHGARVVVTASPSSCFLCIRSENYPLAYRTAMYWGNYIFGAGIMGVVECHD